MISVVKYIIRNSGMAVPNPVGQIINVNSIKLRKNESCPFLQVTFCHIFDTTFGRNPIVTSYDYGITK